jgi:hypothetical protein
MGKAEKLREKWKTSKQPASKQDLETFLNHYFTGRWEYRQNHTYRINLPGFIKMDEYFGPGSHFTIPVSGGKEIKYFYLKKLLKAIEIKEELSNE